VIAIFILAVLSIVVAGMASYTVYTSIRTSEMLTLIGRNASQMDAIAAVLKSNIRGVSSYDAASKSYATRLFLPTPDVDAPAAPSASYVPSWVMPNSRTPWGATYAYCAYAPAPLGGPLGSSAATTPLPYASDAGGGTPSATHDLTAPDGSVRSYMVSGARPTLPSDDGPAPAVLGLIISPAFNSSATPSCTEVTWRGGTFRAGGGSVVAITDDATTRNSLAVPAVMARYVSPAGGGDGGSTQSPATLSDALAEWKAARPNAAVIYLSSGNHPLAPPELDLTAVERMSGRSLRLSGAAGAAIVDTGAAAALTSDADLVLDGISLGAKISLWPQSGARFAAYNSQLRYVLVDAADLLIGQGTTISATPTDVASGLPGQASIEVRAGRLTVQDSRSKAIGGGMPAALSVQGGFVSLNVGSIIATGTGTSWVQISGGSRVASVGGSPSITWNGVAAPSVLPAGLLNGTQRTVETACTETTCVAQCTAQPGAGTRAWFALSGSCSATEAPGSSVAVVESGILPNANPSYLPTDWQCRFAAVATDTVPAPSLPASPGIARAICAPVPIQ
jgi:hypothetical protein